MFTFLLSRNVRRAAQWYNDDIPCPVLPGVCLAQTTDNFLSSPPFLSNIEPGLTETFLPGLPRLVVEAEAKL